MPPLVCGSRAEWPDRGSARLLNKYEVLETAAELLADPSVTITGANIAFDFGVVVNEAPSLLKSVFKAYEEGRVHDILLSQALDAVAGGHLGLAPTGMPLLNAKGRRTDRYDLDICVRLDLHRYDAKENDFYRMRYAILDRVPMPEWPAEAKQYPVDDAWNEVEVAAKQLGIPEHPPEEIVYGDPALDEGSSWLYDSALDGPQAQPALVPFRNLGDQAGQARAAWALHLGAAWGFQADPLYIELLELRAKELHKIYVDRFAKVGLYKLDDRSERLVKQAAQEKAARAADEDAGESAEDVEEEAKIEAALLAQLGYKRDTAAVARAVAKAYGATDPCPRCGGDGKVRRVKRVPCRGAKGANRRYLGCLNNATCVCGGSGGVDEPQGIVICAVKEGGCGGTGFDIRPEKVPSLPRTPKHGVSASRDTLMESGDDELHAFGLNQQGKILSTYSPYLPQGHRPTADIEAQRHPGDGPRLLRRAHPAFPPLDVERVRRRQRRTGARDRDRRGARSSGRGHRLETGLGALAPRVPAREAGPRARVDGLRGTGDGDTRPGVALAIQEVEDGRYHQLDGEAWPPALRARRQGSQHLFRGDVGSPGGER